MKKLLDPILDELNNSYLNSNKEHLIETSGTNSIESTTQPFEQIP